MEERQIIESAGKGSHEAFEQIVKQYEKMVYNICLRMTGDTEEAFDLSQETFIKAWHAISLFKFESKFSTWLTRIAANTCMDYLRKQKRRQVVSLTATEDDSMEEMLIADDSTDPAALAEKAEDHEAVQAAFAALPAQDRLILSMRAIEDMSYQEIGEALDLKPGTVKSKIARARERVRQNLNGNLSGKSASNDRKGGVRR